MNDADRLTRIEIRLDDEFLYRRALAVQMDGLAKTQEEQSEQFESIRGELEANTRATDEIKQNTGEMLDLFRAWQGAMKVFEVIGKAAKPLAAIASLGAAAGAWWLNLRGGK